MSTDKIDTTVADRSKHVDAIKRIDRALADVDKALSDEHAARAALVNAGEGAADASLPLIYPKLGGSIQPVAKIRRQWRRRFQDTVLAGK